METVAETQNPAYRDVEKIVNKNEDSIFKAIDGGAPFEIVVLSMIANLVVEIHGIDTLNNTDITEYMSPIFELYLKKPTRTFCSQNGVPIIKSVKYLTYVHKLRPGEDIG